MKTDELNGKDDEIADAAALERKKAAAALGSAKTAAKSAAARENGRKGGRPPRAFKPTYYTVDAQGLRIEEDAQILRIEAQEESEVLDAINEACGGRFTAIAAGHFGDCWIKAYGNGEIDISPFGQEQVRIEAPGHHPGGNCRCITPIPTVYVGIGWIDDE